MPSEKGTAVVSKTTKGVKSRTGCRTCKIRRVKCDETKPSCTRCLSSGRTCDGYDMAVSRTTNTSPLPAVLRYGYFRNKKEDRYFHYFRHSTVLDLVGFYYQSEFWCETVLQFSETSAAVLHAALALSTFHEHLRTSTTPCTSALFLNQYNKSIAHLRSKNSNQPVQFTLTCCILFICLENAQGNHDMALLHLKNGLNILQDWRKQTCKLPSEERIRENITQVFRRLDMQATVFLDSRKPQINATTILEDYDMEISIPECFSSLRDAQLALEIIEIRLFYVLTAKANDATSRSLLLKGSAARYAQWKVAFDALSVHQFGTMQTRDLQLGLLLALHHQTTSLMLDGKLDPGPNWSEDSRFSQINDLSRSLIRSSSSSNLKFSADLGIIAPLYFTAMNSASDQLRREAIDLLRTAKTKEGFWEAGTAAMIAENVLKVKEVGTPGVPVTGGIQFLAQVHCIISP